MNSKNINVDSIVDLAARQEVAPLFEYYIHLVIRVEVQTPVEEQVSAQFISVISEAISWLD